MKLSLSEIQYKCVEVVWGYLTLKQERRMKLVPAYAWQFSPRMLLFFSPCKRRVKQIMDLFRTEILICWIYFSLTKDRFVIASKNWPQKCWDILSLSSQERESNWADSKQILHSFEWHLEEKTNKQNTMMIQTPEMAIKQSDQWGVAHLDGQGWRGALWVPWARDGDCYQHKSMLSI